MGKGFGKRGLFDLEFFLMTNFESNVYSTGISRDFVARLV